MLNNSLCNPSYAFSNTKTDKKLKQKQDETITKPNNNDNININNNYNNISEIKKKPNSGYQMKNEDFSQNMAMNFYSADKRNYSKPAYENGLCNIKKENSIEAQNENDLKNMLIYQQQQQPQLDLAKKQFNQATFDFKGFPSHSQHQFFSPNQQYDTLANQLFLNTQLNLSTKAASLKPPKINPERKLCNGKYLLI